MSSASGCWPQVPHFISVTAVQGRLAPGLSLAAAQAKDIERNDNEGIGKPEPFKHGFHGYWSRRITDEHRLVYKISEDELRIAACRYHYAT